MACRRRLVLIVSWYSPNACDVTRDHRGRALESKINVIPGLRFRSPWLLSCAPTALWFVACGRANGKLWCLRLVRHCAGACALLAQHPSCPGTVITLNVAVSLSSVTDLALDTSNAVTFRTNSHLAHSSLSFAFSINRFNSLAARFLLRGRPRILLQAFSLALLLLLPTSPACLENHDISGA